MYISQTLLWTDGPVMAVVLTVTLYLLLCMRGTRTCSPQHAVDLR